MTCAAAKLSALVAITATSVVAVLPASGGAAVKRPLGKTRIVGVFSDYYDRDKLTIHVGDKVKWIWHASGFNLHDVYVDSGPETFNSPTQASGTFLHRFKKAGTFKLYCTQHSDMTATIVVKRVKKK